MGAVQIDATSFSNSNSNSNSGAKSNVISVEMIRKAVILSLRNRRSISIVTYGVVLFLLAVLVYDPTYLDAVFPFLAANTATDSAGVGSGQGGESVRSMSGEDLVSTAKPAVVRKLLDLPFVPRDFQCDEMHLNAGRNFSYPEGYMDHADAYKSALQLNNLLDEASSNEQSWLLQDIAQLPFVRTVCETGFNAGHNSFHILTANYDVVVHSFESLRRFNYTLEMTDFMIIEFPDRFYVYDGEPHKSLAKYIIDQANQTTCDISIVDSSQPRHIVREYLRLFRSAATPSENLVIMNAHPDNVVKSPHGAEAEWEALKRAGKIVEHFRCRHAVRDLTANQMGLLVGSFVF